MLETLHPLFWGLLALALLLSAFFSSSETAFLTLNRVKVKHLAAGGAAWAQRAIRIVEPPDRLLASILLGNNLVNTGAAVLGTVLLVSLLGEEWGVPAATVGVTALLLVFGEVTPKILATRYNEPLAKLYVRPLEFVIGAFSPFANLVGWASSTLSRLARGPKAPRSLVAEEELKALISVGAAEGSLEAEEARLLHRVFRFGDRQVREVMVPRKDVVWVEKGTKLEEFLGIYAASPHTRYPVYEETVDNVVGVLFITEVFLAQARGQPVEPVTDLARPAYFVPETKPIGDLFAEMESAHQPMVLVADEHGGVAGLVTLQLLVEEIVGRLGDELARPVKEYQKVDEHTYILDGGLSIQEANEELGLGLPPGRYETVAGFVLSHLGHIPQEGENLRLGDLKMVVAQMKGVKISQVLVSRR